MMLLRVLWKSAVTSTLFLTSAVTLANGQWHDAMTGADWDGSIGVGAFYAPDYLGSDDYETRVDLYRRMA